MCRRKYERSYFLRQNFAGWTEIKVEGVKGTVATLLHAEVLNDDNGLKSRGNDGPEGTLYRTALRRATQIGKSFPKHPVKK